MTLYDKSSWPTFESSMKRAVNYNESRIEQNKWDLLVSRYNLIKDRPVSTPKIPKIIHQIWIGGNMPKTQKDLCENVKNFLASDWTYMFWTEEDVYKLKSFKNLDEYMKTPNKGQKSDLLRYEILNQYGGIYLDTDFIMVKNFDAMLDLDFFCGVAFDSSPNLLNGLIGTTAGNPLIQDILNLDVPIGYSDGMDVINSTGPYLVTRKLFNNIEKMDNVVVFPASFFYPFPNTDINKKPDYKTYIEPETICCHVWHGSWMIL